MEMDAVIPRFFEHMNRQELEAMEALLLPEAVFRFPKTEDLEGGTRIIKFLRILFRKFPELTFTIQGVIREGDRAAVHWTNRGTSKSGEPYANEGVTLMEFEGARLRAISDFFKNTERF